ncbi:MAG: hypothetical protein RL141_1035 [Candidatus Parcubacteria bacterium]|jgi:geranylgeranyl diphosphate synthase type I
MSLAAFQGLFQPVLDDVLREKTEACIARVPDPFLATLLRYPQPLGAQGKRVRPYLAWLFSGARTDRPFLRFIVSLELFHLFALVHDDVMDRGNTRHGIPTVHTFAIDAMARDGRVGDLAHVADGQGILVGDLLHEWSRELFDEGDTLVPHDWWRQARTVFHTMVNEVITGQMIDVDMATRVVVSSDLIARNMRLKTAGYTFVRPLQLGVALTGGDAERMAWSERFGTALGTAFQIQDDLLDIAAPSAKSGKTIFADLRARQHTVLTQWIAEHGSPQERAVLAELMGAVLEEADRARVTQLFESSGAFAHGRAQIDALFQEAEALVQDPAAPVSLRSTLVALVQQVRDRAS